MNLNAQGDGVCPCLYISRRKYLCTSNEDCVSVTFVWVFNSRWLPCKMLNLVRFACLELGVPFDLSTDVMASEESCFALCVAPTIGIPLSVAVELLRKMISFDAGMLGIPGFLTAPVGETCVWRASAALSAAV
jgi:hypothetical protein